jgi:hypothetical protein
VADPQEVGRYTGGLVLSLPLSRLPLNIVQRIFSLLLRLLLLAFGLVAGAVLLVSGLVAGLLIVLWALVRGKRPRVARFRMDPRAFRAGMPQRRATPGDVVDIEAREVPDAALHIERDKA